MREIRPHDDRPGGALAFCKTGTMIRAVAFDIGLILSAPLHTSNDPAAPLVDADVFEADNGGERRGER